MAAVPAEGTILQPGISVRDFLSEKGKILHILPDGAVAVHQSGELAGFVLFIETVILNDGVWREVSLNHRCGQRGGENPRIDLLFHQLSHEFLRQLLPAKFLSRIGCHRQTGDLTSLP